MNKKMAYVHIDGIHCANCVRRIEKSVAKMDGVLEIAVNGATNKGKIVFDDKKMPLEQIMKRIDSLGYRAKEANHLGDASKRTNPFPLLVSIVLTVPLMMAMSAHINEFVATITPKLFMEPLFQFFAAFPIQFIIGRPFYERAFSALKEKTANMDVLVVLSTTIAFFYSYFLMITHDKSDIPLLYFDTSGFIITIILLGRHLEQRMKEKTNFFLKHLLKKGRKHITIIEDGMEKTVPLETVQKGQIVIVKPGEQIPVDGEVIAGSSEVDESLLTGESVPVPKNTSSFVFAGTLNHYGVLYVKVTKEEHETLLAHIVKTVQDAQLKKADIERIADRVTAYFVPVIILLAVFTFILSYFITAPGLVDEALVKMIAVLIVACPCALGLATPASIVAASGRGAQFGLFFKEAKYIENLSSISHIVFDKTGTMTTGAFQVTDVYAIEDDRRLLQQVGAVEKYATHPVGKAIYQHAKKNVAKMPEAKQVNVLAGTGIKGIVDGDEVFITNQVEAKSLTEPIKTLVDRWKGEGKTIVYVYVNGSLHGVFSVSDQIKPDSLVAIQQLKKMNIKPIIASGDHASATQALAKRLGIFEYYASCSPHDKAKLVESLKQKGSKVAMVGDGINDAPALALADVGIAFSSGAGLAVQSSDVTTLSNQMSTIVQGIVLSRKTMRNIKQNFLWAFFYNVLMIPFAMFGVIDPFVAAMAMALSSLTVLMNAMRLSRSR